MKKKKCKHSEFIENITERIDRSNLSNGEKHYIGVELFVYLHKGKDYCNCKGRKK
jgi:hypothetical protein